MSALTVTGIVVAVLAAVWILVLVARRKLDVRYAAVWTIVGILLIVAAVWPGLAAGVSRLLGFAVPANLILSVGFLVLLAASIQTSVQLTRMEHHMQRLAEELAILKTEVREASGENGRPGEGQRQGPADAA
ncbi:MAG: DUF2304 domain-containing protein [Bifidobacteriaceae bacterium]|jgi:hypothetical protein|nr:DUF2304 domain-containing protein [Bifidobacteriaceae bacterium]